MGVCYPLLLHCTPYPFDKPLRRRYPHICHDEDLLQLLIETLIQPPPRSQQVIGPINQQTLGLGQTPPKPLKDPTFFFFVTASKMPCFSSRKT